MLIRKRNWTELMDHITKLEEKVDQALRLARTPLADDSQLTRLKPVMLTAPVPKTDTLPPPQSMMPEQTAARRKMEAPRGRAYWTPAEDEAIRQAATTGPGWAKRCAEALGRTVQSIHRRCQRLGVSRVRSMSPTVSPRTPWSKREDDILRGVYGRPDWAEKVSGLSNGFRTVGGVKERARKLGLLNEANGKPVRASAQLALTSPPNQTKPWTVEDDLYMIEFFCRVGNDELARALGRNEAAVSARAYQLRMMRPPNPDTSPAPVMSKFINDAIFTARNNLQTIPAVRAQEREAWGNRLKYLESRLHDLNA